MLIRVENCQEVIQIDEALNQMIEKVVNLAFQEEGFSTPSELNIIFVDNEEIREINNEHRGIDKPTDVLSFPMAEIKKGVIGSSDYDKDPETGLLILGDIVISTEKCIEQSNEFGHSINREIMFMVTHGIFHIMGYDHLTLEDEKEMIAKQEKVLSQIGLERG